MLPWVVIDRTHSRQATLSFFPCSHSRFGSHPSLIPEKITPLFSRTYVQPILQPVCFQIHACNGDMPPFPPCLFTLLHRSIESQVTKSPVVHPLYAQQLTKCSSRNSFILKTIHFDGGYGVPSDLRTFRRSNVQKLQRFLNLSPLFSYSCALFCTFLHFFALPKNSTLLFSSDSALCVKKHNHRGSGRGGQISLPASPGPGNSTRSKWLSQCVQQDMRHRSHRTTILSTRDLLALFGLGWAKVDLKWRFELTRERV
jgi:hypothetical protein